MCRSGRLARPRCSPVPNIAPGRRSSGPSARTRRTARKRPICSASVCCSGVNSSFFPAKSSPIGTGKPNPSRDLLRFLNSAHARGSRARSGRSCDTRTRERIVEARHDHFLHRLRTESQSGLLRPRPKSPSKIFWPCANVIFPPTLGNAEARTHCGASPPWWLAQAADCLPDAAPPELSRIAQLDQGTALADHVCTRRKRTCCPQGGSPGLAFWLPPDCSSVSR